MSDPALDEIHVFPALAGDYDDVMSISGGIYNGMDYLPFKYHSWLKDPLRKMFVAKSKGKMVAFESFLLVDGGVTAVLQGLRVAAWMRGQGVAGIIQNYCYDTLRSAHPEVKRVRLTRAEDPPASMLEKYHILHSKAVISVVLPADQLEKNLEMLESKLCALCKGRPSVPSILSPSEVCSLFEGLDKGEDLLPKGLLIQGWLPLNPHRANLELLLGTGVHWLYTKSCDFSASSTPVLSTAGFLSLGTPLYPVPLEKGMYRFDIDLFGTDPLYAMSHTCHQLRQAIQILPSKGSIVCFLYAEHNLREDLTTFFHGFLPFKLLREQLILEMNI
ncbi:probable N-acetyltransferase 16 [Bombina bombina]|uniref:probable N-acetyltransferase 16 n=1 Tax=Bombina bombina TaxID=8345 RepID=UPI00235AC51E|nr:probable N-acetyltransferase 16 [Bombina bombina]